MSRIPEVYKQASLRNVTPNDGGFVGIGFDTESGKNILIRLSVEDAVTIGRLALDHNAGFQPPEQTNHPIGDYQTHLLRMLEVARRPLENASDAKKAFMDGLEEAYECALAGLEKYRDNIFPTDGAKAEWKRKEHDINPLLKHVQTEVDAAIDSDDMEALNAILRREGVELRGHHPNETQSSGDEN